LATSLLNLRDNAKELGDFTGQGFVPDTSWNVWANRGQERLYKMAVSTFQDAFEAAPLNFTLVGGYTGNTVALPSTFRRLVHLVKDPTSQSARRRILKYNRAEAEAQGAISYRLIDKSLVLQPFGMCAGQYAAYYLAGPTTLVADGDTLDPIFEPGAEYIEAFMAMRALGKEESDNTDFREDLKELADAFMMDLANRDGAETDTITDIYAGSLSSWPTWLGVL